MQPSSVVTSRWAPAATATTAHTCTSHLPPRQPRSSSPPSTTSRAPSYTPHSPSPPPRLPLAQARRQTRSHPLPHGTPAQEQGNPPQRSSTPATDGRARLAGSSHTGGRSHAHTRPPWTAATARIARACASGACPSRGALGTRTAGRTRPRPRGLLFWWSGRRHRPPRGRTRWLQIGRAHV